MTGSPEPQSPLQPPAAGGSPVPWIALLWRGDPGGPPPDPAATRMAPIFAGLARRGIAAEPVLYADDAAEAVRVRLLDFDGVLVWVDPISDGRDRSRLDPMLRALAAQGLWVSAHPDVILKMGVKEVLYRTRELGWGVDTHLYETVEAFRAEFPARLATGGPRVLKQNRGNGGIGVWKVELAAPGASAAEMIVNVLPARADHVQEGVQLADIMAECEACLAGSGRLIDQAYQARVGDGMVRCYLSQDRVVGFAEQSPRSRSLDDPAAATFGMASGKIMHDETALAFQGLRRSMEADWVPGLQRLLEIETSALPALWDADFLFGPKTAAGEDRYVLCEINVSSVAPFPPTAGDAVAEAAAARTLAAMAVRAEGTR
jgi:hypothetical protein